MTQVRLLSKTLRSFSDSSKSLAKVVRERCQRRCSLRFFFCFHCLRRRGEIFRENERVGRSTKTLGELMKLREDDGDGEVQEANRDDKERGACEPGPGEGRFPRMVRGTKLKQEEKEKEPAGGGSDHVAMVEEVKERERRVKASYEALARLIEVLEVMETSDVEQVSDLKEVLSNYPFITNHSLVDLMNCFILDVSNSILPRT